MIESFLLKLLATSSFDTIKALLVGHCLKELSRFHLCFAACAFWTKKSGPSLIFGLVSFMRIDLQLHP
jgi:hypothetical protein